MLKKIGHQAVLLLLLASNSAYCIGFKTVKTSNVDLFPNKPIAMSNTTANTVTVYCEIHLVSKDHHSVLIKVLEGTGVINGSSLKKGQTMVQTVTHGQMIPIVANTKAQAQFTNLTSNIIKAICN